jgi:hypothetical protein
MTARMQKAAVKRMHRSIQKIGKAGFPGDAPVTYEKAQAKIGCIMPTMETVYQKIVSPQC